MRQRDIVKEERIGDYVYRIFDDADLHNPRTEWENTTRMVCFHKRYNLGDDSHGYDVNDYNVSDYIGWDELLEAIQAEEDVVAYLPVYMYDHSGISLNTTGFSCPWDSGQVGWIYITKDKLGDLSPEWTTQDKLEEIMTGDVQTYEDYINGNGYGYEVYKVTACSLGHDHEELIDSCYGFYGEMGLQDAVVNATGMIKHYTKHDQKTQEREDICL